MAGTITRGKVIRADLAQWDGKTSTYSRLDATGGTITGLALGNEVDVLQVFGSGTSRTRATIASATAHINTSDVTLVFAPGTWTIDSNLTIGSNFTCHVPAGCVFSVDNGITLTFSGDVHVEDPEGWYTGAGTVVVSREGCHGGVWHRTAAERTALVTPVDYAYEPCHVHRYGAIGDGVTSDRTPINNAILVAMQGGATVTFKPGLTYFVGASTSSESIFAHSGLENVVFEGNHAELLATTSGGNYEPILFDLTNPKSLTFNNLRFRDSGADISIQHKGIWAVYLHASGVSGVCGGNVQFNNCYGESLGRFISCGPAQVARIKGIGIFNCSVKTVYYPASFANNGDDVTIVNLNCWNPRRTYFAYGVQNHVVDCKSFYDADAVVPESTHLIKCYASSYPTRNITLRASMYGDLTDYTSYYGVTLEHQPDSGDTGLIENIDAELSIGGATAGFVKPFKLSSYNNTTGLEETTTTDNVWRHIRFGGDIKKYTGHVANSPANWAPIDTKVSPNTECDIELAPSLISSFPFIAFKNNFVLRLAHDRDARFSIGDLTATTITIPLAAFDQTGFVLKIKVWAHDNYSSTGTQNSTYEERFITGYNAGSGNVTIDTNDLLIKHYKGTAASITYAASGENITVTFAGATYNGANARCRVDTEFVSMMRGA